MSRHVPHFSCYTWNETKCLWLLVSIYYSPPRICLPVSICFDRLHLLTRQKRCCHRPCNGSLVPLVWAELNCGHEQIGISPGLDRARHVRRTRRLGSNRYLLGPAGWRWTHHGGGEGGRRHLGMATPRALMLSVGMFRADGAGEELSRGLC